MAFCNVTSFRDEFQPGELLFFQIISIIYMIMGIVSLICIGGQAQGMQINILQFWKAAYWYWSSNILLEQYIELSIYWFCKILPEQYQHTNFENCNILLENPFDQWYWKIRLICIQGQAQIEDKLPPRKQTKIEKYCSTFIERFIILIFIGGILGLCAFYVPITDDNKYRLKGAFVCMIVFCILFTIPVSHGYVAKKLEVDKKDITAAFWLPALYDPI